MSKYRWLGIVVSTMTLAILLLGLFSGSAGASSKASQIGQSRAFKGFLVAHPSNPEKKAIPFVTCSGDGGVNGCTGKDPHTTGCDADQTTVTGGVAYLSLVGQVGHRTCSQRRRRMV